jgi:hypothetical protein
MQGRLQMTEKENTVAATKSKSERLDDLVQSCKELQISYSKFQSSIGLVGPIFETITDWGDTPQSILDNLRKFIYKITKPFDTLQFPKIKKGKLIEAARQAALTVGDNCLFGNLMIMPLIANRKKINALTKQETNLFPIIFEIFETIDDLICRTQEEMTTFHRITGYTILTEEEVFFEHGEKEVEYYNPDKKLQTKDFKAIYQLFSDLFQFYKESCHRLMKLLDRIRVYRTYCIFNETGHIKIPEGEIGSDEYMNENRLKGIFSTVVKEVVNDNQKTIPLSEALKKCNASRSTLLRDIEKGNLKSHRSKDAKPNSKHFVLESDVIAKYGKR